MPNPYGDNPVESAAPVAVNPYGDAPAQESTPVAANPYGDTPVTVQPQGQTEEQKQAQLQRFGEIRNVRPVSAFNRLLNYLSGGGEAALRRGQEEAAVQNLLPVLQNVNPRAAELAHTNPIDVIPSVAFKSPYEGALESEGAPLAALAEVSPALLAIPEAREVAKSLYNQARGVVEALPTPGGVASALVPQVAGLVMLPSMSKAMIQRDIDLYRLRQRQKAGEKVEPTEIARAVAEAAGPTAMTAMLVGGVGRTAKPSPPKAPPVIAPTIEPVAKPAAMEGVVNKAQATADRLSEGIGTPENLTTEVNKIAAPEPTSGSRPPTQTGLPEGVAFEYLGEKPAVVEGGTPVRQWQIKDPAMKRGMKTTDDPVDVLNAVEDMTPEEFMQHARTNSSQGRGITQQAEEIGDAMAGKPKAIAYADSLKRAADIESSSLLSKAKAAQEAGNMDEFARLLDQNQVVALKGQMYSEASQRATKTGVYAEKAAGESLDSMLSEQNENSKGAEWFARRRQALESRPAIETGKPYESTVYRGESPATPVDEGMFGKGTYYTQNASYANQYAKGGKVTSGVVRLQNPFVATNASLAKIAESTPGRDALNGKALSEAESVHIRNTLEGLGHDGIVLRHNPSLPDEVVVFDPSKSIITKSPEAAPVIPAIEPTTGQPIPAIKGVEPKTVEKGIRVEASDHPEVAAKAPELLPSIVQDELKLDKSAYAKDKDPSPQPAQPIGGITVRAWHGTNSESVSEFSLKESQKREVSALGEGFYASPDQGYAKSFGKNVHEVDITLKNPASATQAQAAMAKARAQRDPAATSYTKQDAARARQDLIDQGFDGVYDPSDTMFGSDVVSFYPEKQVSKVKPSTQTANARPVPAPVQVSGNPPPGTPAQVAEGVARNVQEPARAEVQGVPGEPEPEAKTLTESETPAPRRPTEDNPGLYDYADEKFITNTEYGPTTLEDLIDHPRLFQVHPYLGKLEIKYVGDSNRVLNGEAIRIVTTGNGEGTIYINRSYWDDALNGKDPAAREQLFRAVVHEAGHAADDRLGTLSYDTPEEIARAEKFATDFQRKWAPKNAPSGSPESAPTVKGGGGKPPVEPPKTAVAAPAPAPKDPVTTALNKAEIDSIRSSLKLDELPQPEAERFVQVLKSAKDTGADKAADALAEDVINNPRDVTPVEHAGMVVRAAELENLYDEMLRDADAASAAGDRARATELWQGSDKILSDLDKLTQASDIAGTRAGRALSVRRLRIDRDNYSAARTILRAKQAKGAELTPAEQARLTNLSGELAKREAKIESLQNQLKTKLVEASVRDAQTFVNEGISTRTAATRAKAAADRAKYKEQLVKLGYRVNDITGTPEQAAEVASLVAKIAKTYIDEGAATLTEVLGKIKEDIPDLSDQDIYNSLGGRIRSAAAKIVNEVKVRQRELKTQAALWAKIHDAIEGRFEKGKARPVSEKVGQLREILGRLRLQADRTTMDNARLLRINAKITEIQDQLKGQYRLIPEPKEAPRPTPPSIESAKAKLNELERLMRTTDEIADLNEQLRTGVFKVSEPERRIIQNKELEKALVERRQLRREVNERINQLRSLKVGGVFLEIGRAARAAKATADISSLLRQGFVLDVAHPEISAKAIVPSTKALFSQYSADAIQQAIFDHPNQAERLKAGLELSDMDASPRGREEYFESNFLEKVPGVGHIVRASNRHMTVFLNLQRVGVFDWFLKTFPDATSAQKRAFAEYINAATGKGDLGRFKQAAATLNAVGFAPRFAVSRFQVLNSPFKNARDPLMRQIIAKDMVKHAAFGTTVLGLAALAGAKVGLNPNDADFGKIVIKNHGLSTALITLPLNAMGVSMNEMKGEVHIDIWGGLQQPMRLMMLPVMAGLNRAGIIHLDKDIDLIDAGLRFLSYKASPLVTLPATILTGKNVVKQKESLDETLLRAIAPMMIEQSIDIWRADLSPNKKLGREKPMGSRNRLQRMTPR